tara:strand:- start:3990 stop:5807 length:1818 start_codon:yes stop_codon:yes gene_type:complete
MSSTIEKHIPLQVLSHGSKKRRDKVIASLIECGTEILSTLEPMCHHGSWRLRQSALRVVATLKGPDAPAFLLPFLRDTNWRVVAQVIELLGQHAEHCTEETRTTIYDIYKQARTKTLRTACIESLSQHHDWLSEEERTQILLDPPEIFELWKRNFITLAEENEALTPLLCHRLRTICFPKQADPYEPTLSKHYTYEEWKALKERCQPPHTTPKKSEYIELLSVLCQYQRVQKEAFHALITAYAGSHLVHKDQILTILEAYEEEAIDQLIAILQHDTYDGNKEIASYLLEKLSTHAHTILDRLLPLLSSEEKRLRKWASKSLKFILCEAPEERPLHQNIAYVRAILAQTPDRHIWRVLCALMDSWPEGPDKEACVDYANAHMGHWDDSLRLASSDWREEIVEGHIHAHWRLVRDVSFDNHPLDEDFETFLGSPALTLITRLSLRGKRLTKEAFRALAMSPYTNALTHLFLHRTGFDTGAARIFERATHFDALQKLYLSENPIKNEGLIHLLNARFMQQLTYLNLNMTHLSAGAGMSLHQLAKGALYKLLLANNQLTYNDVKQIVETEGWTSLQFLDVHGNQLSEDELRTGQQETHKTPFYVGFVKN